MFHYRMPFSDVMQLPIMAFWFLNGQIHRHLAELDLRALSVQSAAVAGPEGQKPMQDSLIEEIGKTSNEEVLPDLDAKPEPGAFDTLRSLSR